LTLKEPSAQSFPLIFKRLLEVEANYYVVTEWKKEDSGKMRRVIQAKRRHFHNTKRSFASQVSLNDAPAQDVLLDDSKESQVRELGEGIKEIELHGNYFGQFSLTVVIYDLDMARVDRACADFYKVFSVHDAQLYEEKYNLLNAFLAAVPGNHVFNLRFLYLLNTNYADFYSNDRQHLLIPAGSKLLGETKKVDALGQTRLAVVFHRLLMPDGYSVNLDQFKGLDQIGDMGLRDQVNNHYLRIFGVSLAIGALGAVAEGGTAGSLNASSTDLMRQGFAQSTAQSSAQILDKFLNILPTVTIREGHRVKVYLAGDLALPDYSNHKMPSDF
jgi:hypothetical protein